MESVREYVSGLDVHKKSVVAAVITPQGRRVKTFSTTTRALLELVDWLKAEGVRHVAMESTGIYWRPVVRNEAPRIRVGRKESHLRPVAAGR